MDDPTLLAFGLVSKDNEGIAVGEPAPDTELTRLHGGAPATLADYRGKWALVNFWASWCRPCRDEAPILESFYRRNRGRGVDIVGVDTQDLSGDAEAFVREFDLTYPQLRDGTGDFSQEQLGTTGVPESFLLDPRGRLVLHALGPVSEDYLRSNLLPNLEGRATG